MPEVELLPSTKITYGDSFTIHAWLLDYEDKPENLRFYVDVVDSHSNQVDSTLWFARQDFVYEFDTTHPAYNITKSGTYKIKLEHANLMQRTGFMHKTLEFEIDFPDKHPSPLKQFKSGISINEIQCRENLILILKHDNSPVCVKPETISKLIERGWTTQLIVHDIVMKTMSKNLGPECAQNTMQDIMDGKIDERCAKFLDELFIKRQSDMTQQGYAFDQEIKFWTKEGYPDMLMSIVDYYQQNLDSKTTHESESLDIASIEDRYIHLNPADMCATISLELMSPDELEQTKSGSKNVVFLELDDDDLDELPILDELIRATHHLEFPANDYSRTEMGMRELVDYEFFIMEKAIEKYGNTQDDYFMKLDSDLDERLADLRKQGFSNEFIAPQIVYNENVYVLGHTIFWVSDEHEMQSMSVHLKENLDELKKFVTLNDMDMESIPKIREAIEKIGTELESVVAFKGLPENPDWNQYREWYAKKSAEQFDTDKVYVRGFVYENEYYDLGFLIC